MPPAVAVPDELRQAECLMWLVDALSAHDRGMVAARDMRLAIAGAHVRAWRKWLGGESERHPDTQLCNSGHLILAAIRFVGWSEVTQSDLRHCEAVLRTIWHRGQK